MTKSLATPAFAIVALVIVACGGGGGGGGASPSTGGGANQSAGGGANPSAGGAGGATTVNADEKEFSIGLDKTTVPAGDVTFNVKNTGAIEHEFVVIDTDTQADALPVEG